VHIINFSQFFSLGVFGYCTNGMQFNRNGSLVSGNVFNTCFILGNRLGIGCQEDMGEATFGSGCGQGVKIIFEFKSRVCSRNKNIYPARRN